ncbi:MAG: UvrD-helicase domain-containing protein [Gemmatimonadota bacterium]|nr:UvrD-helicase domain-containing protein [Gemmatimonadota bacterium]MDQ8147695.1 UvrD-helicase domain-containing protein [Gemmatimonadota bacterium]
MSQSDVLIEVSRGSVVAPAGCGKTRLIVDAMCAIRAARPVLILTHTNAGVSVLRGRLAKSAIHPKSFRVQTLDGWAMRMVSMFPVRSGVRMSALELRNPGADYPEIRRAAVRLVVGGDISDLLRTTYARVWVDEYQDCNALQHAMVRGLSNTLPTVVLGDPLQAIFGFGANNLPSWEREVCVDFPRAAELDIPWRWNLAGAPELGQWLLDIRSPLRSGSSIDLSTAPKSVEWIRLTGDVARDTVLQVGAASRRLPGGGGSALILADSRNPALQHQFASRTRGAVAVEAVEMRDFISFSDAVDSARSGAEVLRLTTEIAAKAMTSVRPAELSDRVEIILKGSARKAPSAVERAAVELCRDPSAGLMAALLSALRANESSRVFRPTLLSACLQMARIGSEQPSRSYGEVARRIREELRFGLRPVPVRAVGSTLLLKGLEADIAVVLDTSPLEPEHLYVAMTRGAKQLVVCSPTQILLA